MSRRVRRHGDRIRWELEDFEESLLRDLDRGLDELLRTPQDAVGDPVLERLFPAAVAADDAEDAELRRLIFDDLLESRRRGLHELVALLDRGEPHRDRLRVELSAEEAALVLGVLNDLRLALGARIGIERLDRDELDEDHPAAPSVAVLDHLAWFQEQIIEVLDPPSVSH